LFVAFSAPRSYNWIGSWGIKEFITQDAKVAPKYRGLMYFQTKNRCWWHGCTRMGGIARMSKPPYNPGASVMARRFKPRLSEETIKTNSTTMLVVNAKKQRQKVLNVRKVATQKQQYQQAELRIRKGALQKKKDDLFLQKAATALFKEERNQSQNPVFSF
ncbi:MAG: hypothetical protein KAG34_05625, partial [Cocleimonas sp.]|nr:hypothetical protein [Cocleimonas sp.]